MLNKSLKFFCLLSIVFSANLCGGELACSLLDLESDSAIQQECRYLDLDGDGVDEALVPLRQIDPPSLYRQYGIARKNESGAWDWVKTYKEKDDSSENIATIIFSCREPVVAFDSVFEKKRGFSVWNPVSGIHGFYCLTETGLEKCSRERLLTYLRVGEFRLLKGLRVIPEQSDCTNIKEKVVALRLAEDGCVSASIHRGSVISIYWTPDTCGAKYNAFPQPLLTIPIEFQDKIAGVIFHGKGELRLGILFDEDAGGASDCHLYGSPAYGNLLDAKRFSTLERYAFSEKTDEKVLTEFFSDDGRVREGKVFSVIWFERNQYGFRAVRQKNMAGANSDSVALSGTLSFSCFRRTTLENIAPSVPGVALSFNL